MNTQNGHRLERVIKKILGCLKAILRKLENLPQRLNLDKSTKLTSISMKGRSGTLIGKTA